MHAWINQDLVANHLLVSSICPTGQSSFNLLQILTVSLLSEPVAASSAASWSEVLFWDMCMNPTVTLLCWLVDYSLPREVWLMVQGIFEKNWLTICFIDYSPDKLSSPAHSVLQSGLLVPLYIWLCAFSWKQLQPDVNTIWCHEYKCVWSLAVVCLPLSHGKLLWRTRMWLSPYEAWMSSLLQVW